MASNRTKIVHFLLNNSTTLSSGDLFVTHLEKPKINMQNTISISYKIYRKKKKNRFHIRIYHSIPLVKFIHKIFVYLFSGNWGDPWPICCCSNSAICFNFASAWPLSASSLHAKLPSLVILTLEGGITGNRGPKLDFRGLGIKIWSSLEEHSGFGTGSITTSTKPRLLASIIFSKSSELVLDAESFNLGWNFEMDESVSELWFIGLFFNIGRRVSS